MRALLEACRPRQWVKNLFVAAPLVFAKRLTDPRPSLRALAAVAIFCAVSSAVYLWNDLVDVEKDRVHPHKKNRPIADGRLSTGMARIAAATLAAGGLALAWLLDWRFACCVLAYLANNVAYSLWIKRVVYLDVLSIAGGFLVRVAAGAFAVDVEASAYLFLCTGLLATYLGFGKRAHELAVAGERAGEQRAVLRAYRPAVLRVALYLTAAATFVCYVLYTRAEHTVRFFGTTRMLWTAPFAAFGLVRFFVLVQMPKGESPTEEILKDVPFVLNLLAWAAAITLIIYFR
ncbi:MAG TPA: decaprenyl-phosphate phosphoribosyltransferase [Polyangia bacterium]